MRLSLEHPHRNEPGGLARKPGLVDYFNDFVHVFIGFGDFLEDAVAGLGTNVDSLRFQLALDRLNVPASLGGRAAEHPARAVANASESLFHRLLRADQDPRR